jgi:hypothetical protein
MAEEKKQGFFDQLKDATAVVVQKTREGVEDLQQKRELSETYGELGRKTAELAKSGAITHPDLAPFFEKIDELEAALAAPPPGAEPPETPAG